jgi:hypothetical protein
MTETKLLSYCEFLNVPMELRAAVVTVLQTNKHFPGVDKEAMHTIADWATTVSEFYAEPVAGYNYETGLVD